MNVSEMIGYLYQIDAGSKATWEPRLQEEQHYGLPFMATCACVVIVRLSEQHPLGRACPEAEFQPSATKSGLHKRSFQLPEFC